MPQDRELLLQAPPTGEKIGRTLAAYEPLSSAAREPRKARWAQLGNSLWSVQQ